MIDKQLFIPKFYNALLLNLKLISGLFFMSLVMISCKESVEINENACIQAKIIGGQPCTSIAFVQVLNYKIGEKYSFNGKTYENVIAINNLPLAEQINFTNDFYFNIDLKKQACREYYLCHPLLPITNYPLPSMAFCAKNFSESPCN